MDCNYLSWVLIMLEIISVGIIIVAAVIKFYSLTLKKLQNHDDRLIFIEHRLEKIEKKLDTLNGRMKNHGY